MPNTYVSPTAAAPADRLNLSFSMVRGTEPTSITNNQCWGTACFADEDATPSYGAGQCSYNCAVFDE